MSLTDVIAIDCERVQLVNRKEGLGQVCIVNQYGTVCLNKYVRPQKHVVDYRYKYSGLTQQILNQRGEDYYDVRSIVCDVIRGRILVGHDIERDLKALGLCHPPWRIRDTCFFFKRGNNKPGLVTLARKYLGKNIRANGVHSCVEDAKTTMQLYNLVAEQWEESETESDDVSEYYYGW